MITYLPLNYDTSVVLWNIFEVTCTVTHLMDVVFPTFSKISDVVIAIIIKADNFDY